MRGALRAARGAPRSVGAALLLSALTPMPAALAQLRPRPAPPDTERAAPPAARAALAPAPRPDVEAAAAEAAVDAFIAQEARGDARADTLLASDATFIMTGIRVTTRPRLAGLNGPGDATIEEATTSLAGPFAWVVVGYRFEGRTRDLDERARATFVLEKQRAGWRIRHVHSSMVERW